MKERERKEERVWMPCGRIGVGRKSSYVVVFPVMSVTLVTLEVLVEVVVVGVVLLVVSIVVVLLVVSEFFFVVQVVEAL